MLLSRLHIYIYIDQKDEEMFFPTLALRGGVVGLGQGGPGGRERGGGGGWTGPRERGRESGPKMAHKPGEGFKLVFIYL